MTGAEGRGCRLVMAAVEDFRHAADADDLWGRLHRHLAGFGVARVMYGSQASPQVEREVDILMHSYDPAFVEAKVAQGLFYSDEYVRASRVETAPILWSEAGRLENLRGKARRSLELDWDYRVLTGVTLPMRFHNGMGRSGIGLHAPDMHWFEFDRLWHDNARTISAICNAFDVRLREAHAAELIALSPRERECLLWLVDGLRQQQIAYRLDIHVKTVEKHIEAAKRKLKAATVAQAVAVALLYDLLRP